MNIEIAGDSTNSPVVNTISISLSKQFEDIVSENISLPIEIKDMFIRLRTLMGESEGKKWDVCDMSLSSEGKYHIDFSYSGVKRLAGDFDDGSKFRIDDDRAEYDRSDNELHGKK